MALHGVSLQDVLVLAYRDARSGAVLARCSQPTVGWLGWRSPPDENLLKEISKACSSDGGSQSQSQSQSQACTPTAKDQREHCTERKACEESVGVWRVCGKGGVCGPVRFVCWGFISLLHEPKYISRPTSKPQFNQHMPTYTSTAYVGEDRVVDGTFAPECKDLHSDILFEAYPYVCNDGAATRIQYIRPLCPGHILCTILLVNLLSVPLIFISA